MDFDALNAMLSDTSKCRWHPDGLDGIRNVPDCGAPATTVYCVPFLDTPTCDAHKCRCAKAINPEVA